MLDDDACYEVLKSGDARFDGQFFVGVSSTKIYCRPVCSAKLPKRENCSFFPTAAAAEAAGYRPCLKCRPEVAPGTPAFPEMDDVAARAAAALREGTASSVAALAEGLGVSERHLRRVFEERFGVTLQQYRTTCRLLLAKSLLTESDLSIAAVARACGFASARRFEEAFSEHYRMAPSRFRKGSCAGASPRVSSHAKVHGASGQGPARDPGVSMLLGYRKPYRFDLLLGFLEFRAIAGVESVSGGVYKRTVRVGDDVGWVSVRDRPEKSAIELTVSEGLHGHLPLMVAKTRLLFDTDCDPSFVEERLEGFYACQPECFHAPGVRVPCSFSGFEMAARAVLGQQITVKAANTLAGRVAAEFGVPLSNWGLTSPFPELTCVFPEPEAFLQPGVAERLGELGVIGQRARSICALARLVSEGRLSLKPGADVRATEQELLSIPGIGPWTAHYILMRALAYPDALPSTDYAVKHAFPGLTPKKIEELSRAWSPVRSYAVMSLWSAPGEVWKEIVAKNRAAAEKKKEGR